MGAKKSGRVLYQDFAFDGDTADSEKDITFFEGIEASRVAAGLAEGALLGVEVIEWDGPGGGWPYIKLTFDSLESLARWSWVMWDGDSGVLDDLDFSPRVSEKLEAVWGDIEAMRIAADGEANKYERRCLDAVFTIMKEKATAA